MTIAAGRISPPTITSFTAVEGSPTTLRIEWTDVEGEENYRVTATPDDDSPEFIDIASANAIAFEFTDAVVGATYTAEWAIVPCEAPDYWRFINTCRRLVGANFTIPGAFAFLRASFLRTMC